jgi:glycosyltransferase involved in cell wall biosynthesis
MLKKGPEEGMARFGREVFTRLVHLLPEDEWVVVVDGRNAILPFILPRTEVVKIPISSHNPLGMLLYLEYWIPRIAQEKQAEALFSPDGWSPLSLKIPIVPVIHDINFERRPEWIAWHWRHLYRFYFSRLAKSAQHVFTVSDFSRRELMEVYGLNPSSVTVAFNAPSTDFRSLNEDEKQKVRNRYSNGQPYVLVPTSLHPRKNVNNVLKAYDKALSMKADLPMMIFTGGKLWSDSRLDYEIGQLRKKGKLKMLGIINHEEMTLALGAAEAVIYMSLYEGFGLPVVEAQAAGVPVLTSCTSALPEVGGEGCLYADPENPDDIAEKIITLYYDNELRKSLIEKGLKNVGRYNWNKTAHVMATVLKDLFPR